MILEPVPGCDCRVCRHLAKTYTRKGVHVAWCFCPACFPEGAGR